MAATKTFETQFRIGAKYTGANEVRKANAGINSIERNAKRASASMHKAFAAAAHKMRGALKGAFVGVGVGVAAAGTAAVYGLVKGLQTSIDAALAVEKTQEHLAASLEKTAKRWKLNQQQVKLQQQAITALGDRMAKLGPDGETVVAMLDEVTRSVDPRSLHKYTKGLTDFLISQKGVNATEEDAIALGADVAKLIEFKMPKALKAFKGVTDDQIKAYSKLETRQQREIWFFKNIAKESGATERAFATASGKTQKFRNMLEDVAETVGEPFVKLRGQLSETGIAILEKLKPKIDQFAAGLEERLTQANAWWNEHQAEVVEAIGKIGDAVLWCIDHWKELMTAFAATAAIAALIAILGALALAISGVTLVLGLILTPIGLVVTALAGLGIGIAAVIWYWDDLKRAALGAWEAINQASQSAVPPTSSGTGVPFGRQPGDYTPEWGPQGGTSGSAGGGALPTGETSNAGLAAARAALIAEMEDPKKRARLYARVKGEVGSQGEDAIQKQMENMFNRAYVRGLTMDEVVAQGGKAGRYWGSTPKGVSDQEAAAYDRALTGVKGGSNKANLATGNESANLRNGRVVATAAGGERFVIEPADVGRHERLRKAYEQGGKARGPVQDTKMIQSSAPAAWPGGVQYKGKPLTPSTGPVGGPHGSSLKHMIKGLDMRGRMSGASGGQNVASLSPSITINATTTSDAQQIAEKVRGALKQSSTDFLASARKARSDEQRLNFDFA